MTVKYYLRQNRITYWLLLLSYLHICFATVNNYLTFFWAEKGKDVFIINSTPNFCSKYIQIYYIILSISLSLNHSQIFPTCSRPIISGSPLTIFLEISFSLMLDSLLPGSHIIFFWFITLLLWEHILQQFPKKGGLASLKTSLVFHLVELVENLVWK